MGGENLRRLSRIVLLQALEHVPETVARVTGNGGQVAAYAIGFVLGLGVKTSLHQCIDDLSNSAVELLELGRGAALAGRDAAWRRRGIRRGPRS